MPSVCFGVLVFVVCACNGVAWLLDAEADYGKQHPDVRMAIRQIIEDDMEVSVILDVLLSRSEIYLQYLGESIKR